MNSLEAKYAQSDFFNQEDRKYLSKIIAEPKSIKDVKENIKTIDALLESIGNRQRLSNARFNDWKTTLQGKRNTRLNRPWSEVMDQVLLVSNEVYNKKKIAWGLLKKHYVTGDGKYYQEYAATYQEVERLQEELQPLIRPVYFFWPVGESALPFNL